MVMNYDPSEPSRYSASSTCICLPHERRGWQPTQKENFEKKVEVYRKIHES